MKVNFNSQVGFKSQSFVKNHSRKAEDVSLENNKQMSEALSNCSKSMAMGSIAFTSAKAIQQDKQVYIPNLFNVKDVLFEKKKGANPPFVVDTKETKYGEIKELFVKELDSPVLRLSKNKNAKILPKAVLKLGKFEPTVEFVDTELDIKVKLLRGSKLDAEDFELVLPGKVKTNGHDKDISFAGKGSFKVVTFHNEMATKEAVDLYQEGEFFNKVEKGFYADEVKKDQPTYMVLAGGYGTRLFDYTGEEVNKPAAKLPTDDNYRMMGNAIDQAAKAGILDGENDKITYLSGANTISGDNVEKVIQDVDLGDGGCIAKSIALGTVSKDKPLVILNADTITNADLTRAYKAFKDHPDAAVLIPHYASPENRAKEFGLMAVEKVDNQVSEIKNFVEKPQTLEEAKSAKIEGTDQYMANPGIYIFSPKAVELLGEKGKKMIEEGYQLGLARDFITPLVEKCQKGEVTDDSGNPMKVYTTPLETKTGKFAYWDDLGKTSAIVETVRTMAAHTEKYGANSPENKFHGLPEFLLNDAVKHTDLETSVVSMSDEAIEKLEKFKEKYGVTELEGNVIVFDSAAA